MRIARVVGALAFVGLSAACSFLYSSYDSRFATDGAAGDGSAMDAASEQLGTDSARYLPCGPIQCDLNGLTPECCAPADAAQDAYGCVGGGFYSCREAGGISFFCGSPAQCSSVDPYCCLDTAGTYATCAKACPTSRVLCDPGDAASACPDAVSCVPLVDGFYHCQ
jgi:hypothetical protein